ncbi:MAG: hypothetical protein GF417_11095 [Candidatus Latescibacteria bacterium]|nr:hypothetical protein [bacterium]MBD3424972.1 hypothetical protein [Candidatus Latescibacterota bacterium]
MLTLGLSASCSSRGVRGGERENGLCLMAYASFSWSAASAGFERLIYDPECHSPELGRLIISAMAGPVSLLLNRWYFCYAQPETSFGMEFSITGDFCLVSGCRFGTGEISIGLVYHWGSSSFGIAWSDHPVLGTSMGCGTGRFGRELK